MPFSGRYKQSIGKHNLAEHPIRNVASFEVVEEGHWSCHLHIRSNEPRAYLVYHIGVHSEARRYTRHIVVEEVESMRTGHEGEEVDSRSSVEEAERSFEVGSSLAGAGTAAVDLHNLRCSRILGSLTYLAGCSIVEGRKVLGGTLVDG